MAKWLIKDGAKMQFADEAAEAARKAGWQDTDAPPPPKAAGGPVTPPGPPKPNP